MEQIPEGNYNSFNAREEKIVSGNAKKLYVIGGRFIGTVAGNVEFGSGLINTIKEGPSSVKGSRKGYQGDVR